MKKFAFFLLVVLVFCTTSAAALAASVLYPVEVTEYMQGDTPRICKVYLLPASADPSQIPTATFFREGYTYVLLDMTRADQTATEVKPYTETITVESENKDMEQILSLLVVTKDATTQDGYTGVLTLDTASIKVEAAGYGSSSRTVTATRSYTNLSDADTAFVPKTTEDKGRMLELADVQWQEDGVFYHATATYTGTATSQYATGYTVTATYTGEVSKTTSDTVQYTAIFGGAPILPAAPEVAPFEWGGFKWLALPIGASVVILAVGLIRRGKGRKEKYCV